MKRTIVKSKQEFVDWVNLFNGKMNCYTTVYDYERFAETAKVDSSVILDRMFLDFDAHGDIRLEDAYNDVAEIVTWFNIEDIKYRMFFSGKGFHVIVYGERTYDIRSIQTYFAKMDEMYPTLDRSGIQTNRLRRIPNTVNLSSKGPYFCIPITTQDIDKGLESILLKAKTGNYSSVLYGNDLVNWPNVKPIEMSEIEVESPKSPGELPILPCLNAAIMVENPGHYARVYLAQWYRDILTMGEREIDFERKQELVQIIMKEIETIANKENVWLDWNEAVTKKNVWFIVNGGYHAPGCKSILIPQGYCIGKCWRYCE